jgi:glucose/arabinose dehydrogenase
MAAVRFHSLAFLAAVLAIALPGCDTTMSSGPEVSPASSLGPEPVMPKPAASRLIPTVQIAEARGWPSGGKPVAAPGLVVSAFATGLTHPRWLYVLPNGDVLVAETNTPGTDKGGGIKGMVMRKTQAKAGAGVPSPNRIRLLRDADGDGRAETVTVFAQNLSSPFGMALIGSTLYVANADGVVSFPYQQGQTSVTGAPKPLTDLPSGINHHWTKNILASRDGRYLYATVGSNSNIGENGLDKEEGRAAIWQIDVATGAKRLYATGLRNPNGLAWEPVTGALWAVANERDELGNDLVPDYLTSVREGAFYGWPYSYYGQHVDTRVKPQDSAAVARALAPDYALGAHVAALGLTAATGTTLPPPYGNGMFIGEHGSWNRKPAAGYRVVFVRFTDGKPAAMPTTVLDGFISKNGEAWGRPVGVTIARDGALLVADDVGNTIWRVAASP